jgi:PAS domain S-box-containing protein
LPVSVLVVDDDSELLRTLQDILELKGYEVATAERGRSALELVQAMRDPPIVALVDLRLPDVPGLEVASGLHRHAPNIQVVILTGDASVDSAIHALRSRTVDYLVKPVQPNRLLDTMERACERGLRQRAETALEHERKRKSEILDASPVGMAVVSLDGKLEYLNTSGATILGLSPGSETAQDDQQHRRAEAWLGRVPLPDVLEAGAEATESDREYVRSDGETRQLAVRVTPLCAPDGAVDAVLQVFSDVTEQRRLEEGMRQAQKMEAVGRLAGGVAHDFNNLLTVILARTDILLADLDDDSPLREDLDAILTASHQAADVTRQLLTFSRRQVSDSELLDLNHIVREMQGLLARTIGAHVTLHDHLDPSIPMVEVNPGQLRQVIMNLAINARDAMPGGGSVIFRTGWRRSRDHLIGAFGGTEDGEAGWVFLDVLDTGHGMDEETRRRAFEPFFTTKGEGEGTGLGLATVYGIISQVGGTVDLETAPGRGTQFRIWLPACERPAASTAPEPDGQVAPSRSCRVLIVDDEHRIRTALRRVLEREGHEVLEAGDGDEALDVLRACHGAVHVLLTDVHMPGPPPEEYVPRLLREVPDLRVAVVTGSAALDYRLNIEGLSRPALVIAKPFAMHDVRRTIRELLGEAE